MHLLSSSNRVSTMCRPVYLSKCKQMMNANFSRRELMILKLVNHKPMACSRDWVETRWSSLIDRTIARVTSGPSISYSSGPLKSYSETAHPSNPIVIPASVVSHVFTVFKEWLTPVMVAVGLKIERPRQCHSDLWCRCEAGVPSLMKLYSNDQGMMMTVMMINVLGTLFKLPEEADECVFLTLLNKMILALNQT